VLLRSFGPLEVRTLLQTAASNARRLREHNYDFRALLTQPAGQNGACTKDIERQMARALNNSLRRAASRKKLQRIDNAHSLTTQEVRDMWYAQHGKCAISGVPLVARRGDLPSACMLTIDRVDSSLGYVASNCQLLAFYVNIAKSDHPQDGFVDILAAMNL
jgi:hypothetical protein